LHNAGRDIDCFVRENVRVVQLDLIDQFHDLFVSGTLYFVIVTIADCQTMNHERF
jgi:hypothetical protein